MLKHAVSLKLTGTELANAARDRLLELLGGIPFVTRITLESHPTMQSRADLTVALEAAGSHWILVSQVKQLSQPRHVREAVYQLRRHLNSLPDRQTYGLFIAPYLSEESIALLRGESIGYLDLAGNCFLSFDSIYIERRGVPNSSIRRRALRELFAPKGSRVLRVFLENPARPWRVTDLAQAADVSLGQASNVRRALVDREWALVDSSGVRLKNPNALLDAWRSEYKPPILHETHYYTLLHGAALESSLREAFATPGADQHVLLSSFSAARWLAPFARVPGHFFYADAKGEALLKSTLRLESVPQGANIVLSRPKDDSAFMDRRQVADGLWSTGPLQTYLDLSIAGDRGIEAADHLRRETLDPKWHNLP